MSINSNYLVSKKSPKHKFLTRKCRKCKTHHSWELNNSLPGWCTVHNVLVRGNIWKVPRANTRRRFQFSLVLFMVTFLVFTLMCYTTDLHSEAITTFVIKIKMLTNLYARLYTNSVWRLRISNFKCVEL